MSALDKAWKVLILMIVWVAILIIIDLRLAPPIISPAVAATGEPTITMSFAHLCCTGCYDVPFQAFNRFSWLGKPSLVRQGLPSQEQVVQGTSAGAHAATPGTPDVSVPVNRAQMIQ